MWHFFELFIIVFCVMSVTILTALGLFYTLEIFLNLITPTLQKLAESLSEKTKRFLLLVTCLIVLSLAITFGILAQQTFGGLK